MHSYWFALQRNDFILILPNFGAFFSPFFTKKPAYPLFHGHSSHFTALNLALFFTHPHLLPPNRQMINSLPLLSSSCHDSSTAPFHLSGCRSHSIRLEAKRREQKQRHKKRISQLFCETLRDSDRIQTCNLLIRSQMLYSVELRSHFPQTALQFHESDSDRIQTCNLLIRSQMLYSVELRSRNSEIE